MAHILFHVPHSSLMIPKCFWKVCIKDKSYISNTNKFLCDYLTDKLVPTTCHKVVFKYSRLFCDVEKYLDESKEIMSKKGMGFIYTKDCDNTITIPNSKYKKKVLMYYINHYDKLDKRVTNIIKRYNKCIIIDLHSFSDEMVLKLFNCKQNPDICIGIDPRFTSDKLLDLTV